MGFHYKKNSNGPRELAGLALGWPENVYWSSFPIKSLEAGNLIKWQIHNTKVPYNVHKFFISANEDIPVIRTKRYELLLGITYMQTIHFILRFNV